jgi:hypothetical protein
MVTLIGPAASTGTIWDDGSSNSKVMIGDDCAGIGGYTGIPGHHVPVVGAFGGPAAAQAVAGSNSGTYKSGTETGSATAHDLGGTASPLWQDCHYLHDLASVIRGSADAVCTISSPCSSSYWAATTNSSITFVDRDISLTTGQGPDLGHGDAHHRRRYRFRRDAHGRRRR